MKEHDIIIHLKHLKNLAPDEEFCRTSLSLILKTPREDHERTMLGTFRAGVIAVFERTSLIGAAAFLIFLTVAAFNLIVVQAPLALTGVKLTDIIAEADSIDIQIDLPELGYTESVRERRIANTRTQPVQSSQELSPLNEPSDKEINRLLEELSK